MNASSPEAHHHCFRIAARRPPRACIVALDEACAAALADLLPLLGCGEEAAVLGFDRLAAQPRLEAVSRQALQAIAADERVHDALLGGLQAALPRPEPQPAMRRAAKRFHLSLSDGDAATHLARIAGTDAAVCTILSRLLRPGTALANDPGVAQVIGHIRRDEARHVAVSRSIAIAAIGRGPAREAAAQARHGLADLLAHGASALERIGVDPGRLSRDLRRLPDGLFAR